MNSKPLALLRPITILLLAGAMAFLMISSRSELEARDVELPVPLVEAQLVRKGPVPVTVVAHGNVVAARDLVLTAQVTGRVLWKSERFEPGIVVEAGEALLRIDDTDYRLALAEAEQALASAELALADAVALKQAKRQEEAQASVVAATARIERARRDLRNTEITAPYAAIIDEQQVELGQFVSLGTTLGRILGADRAEIRLPIAPQDVGFIDATLERPVTLSATLGNKRQDWQGELRRIERRIDNQTRVFPVVVSVAEPLDAARHSPPMPFGLFVRAEIPGRDVANAALLPQSTLHGDSDVFLYRDGVLRRHSVTVARVADGQVIITDGIEDGDLVVTTRLDLMFEGMKVALLDD